MIFDPSGLVFYRVLLFICAAGSVFAGVWLLGVLPENLSVREKMPRAVVPGAILGAVDLLWCIPNARPILPDCLHPYLLPLAIVLAVLVWTYLDHLFSRALGGFMILASHALLKESFAVPSSGGVMFAVFCFAFGTVGIFLSGKPHLTREIVRLGAKKGVVRFAAPAFLFCFAGVSLWTLIWNFAGPEK